MLPWKLPPKAKIYEALSAVADDRVKIAEDNTATVVSSAGDKAYVVRWNPELTGISSNDNASFYQGYMGYPMLAVLMLIGKLRFSQEVASHLAGINWNQINKKFRRNYEAAIDSVLAEIEANGVVRTVIDSEVDQIWKQLESMSFDRMPGRVVPPK